MPSQAYDPDCLLPKAAWLGFTYDMRSHIVIFCQIHYYHAKSHHWQQLCEHIERSSAPHGAKSFPSGDAIYQDDNVPVHIAYIVQNWFTEHQDEVPHLSGSLQ